MKFVRIYCRSPRGERGFKASLSPDVEKTKLVALREESGDLKPFLHGVFQEAIKVALREESGDLKLFNYIVRAKIIRRSPRGERGFKEGG